MEQPMKSLRTSRAPYAAAIAMSAALALSACSAVSSADGAATGDPFRMLLQTFSIMGRSINQFELREADVVLRPRLAGVSGADFAGRRRTIAAGREAALAALGELRAKLAARMH